MANPFVRCGDCLGNWWPSGQLKTHSHFDLETNPWPLKLKYRVRGTGWSRAANPRTNAARPSRNTIRPRRRAYGPF